MMKKILVSMSLLLLLQLGVLTVSAKTANPPDEAMLECLGDPTGPTFWDDLSKIGFSNNIMWTISIYDGVEAANSPEAFFDIEKTYLTSAELEPERFYTVVLMFLAQIDTAHPEKYQDVSLQVRMPGVLFRDSVNAIGSAIHGAKIDSDSCSFGISSKEDLFLYYVEDSAEVNYQKDSLELSAEGVEYFFAGEDGIPLQKALTETHEIGGQEYAVFHVQFLLYTAPLVGGGITRGDSELTYWAGRELMQDRRDSVAPQGYVPRIAVVDEDGEIHLPPEPNDTSMSSHTSFIIWACISLIVAGAILYASHAVRNQKAHEEKERIAGFQVICNMLAESCRRDGDTFAEVDNKEIIVEDKVVDEDAENEG